MIKNSFLTKDRGFSPFLLCSLFIITLLLTPAIAKAAEPTIGGGMRFTLYAPMAKEVTLHGSGILRKQKMMRQADGNWTYVSPALASDMYTYNFIIDGEVTQTEPAGTPVVRDVDQYFNYFFVPGWPADYYIDQPVAHGRVEQPWYSSNLNGMAQRRMSVYLPAGYDDDTTRRYPVLYLLHGSGGDETSWLSMGRLQQIMDMMIAQGKCKPMIVVMPNGNAEIDAAPGESPYMSAKPKANNMSSMTGRIEAAFPREVMAYAENKYRIEADKQHRAIAGMSLGGLHTLYISANNPQSFGYVGLFSPQTTNTLNDKKISGIKKLTNGITKIAGKVPVVGGKWEEKLDGKFEKYDDVVIYDSLDQKLAAQFYNPPYLYYIAVGRSDYVMKLVTMHRQRLDAAGYKYEYNESEGGHTWDNWRRYLLDFLPKLF